MSSLGLHTKEFNHPTTDWDDKMRELGLIPPLETDEPPAEDGASASHAPLAAEERGGAAGEEEAELQAIRERRLEELKCEAGGEGERPTGHILEITRDQFVAEVNQAGDGVPVVVFLSKARHYLSSYTRVLLEKLAAKFPDVKFIQMGHTDCIDGYPAANLPTLLIYKDDDLLRQCAPLLLWPGVDQSRQACTRRARPRRRRRARAARPHLFSPPPRQSSPRH